jgi:hypothetical protein
MAHQAASATASLREALKAGPLCRQRTLDPKKISMMALNSTYPGRGTSLILYLGVVVVPGVPTGPEAYRRGLELRPRRTPPHPHLGTYFCPWCHLGESALRRPCLPRHGPPAAATPQQVSPELLGSYGPLALSQKAPRPVIRIGVRRAMTPGAAAQFEVPADQQADNQCSCVRYGECEPSII